MRTPREALVDRILLLYAIDRVNAHGNMEGPFKLMKVPFLSQFALNKRGRKGFNYTFFRYTYGPFSTEIYEDANALERAGFVSGVKHKGAIKLTKQGEELLASLSELFAKNGKFAKEINHQARENGPLSFNQLRRKVYGFQVRYGGKLLPIRDIPSYSEIIGKLTREQTQDDFQIDEDWLDSLHGIFDRTQEDRAKLATIRKAN